MQNCALIQSVTAPQLGEGHWRKRKRGPGCKQVNPSMRFQTPQSLDDVGESAFSTWFLQLGPMQNLGAAQDLWLADGKFCEPRIRRYKTENYPFPLQMVTRLSGSRVWRQFQGLSIGDKMQEFERDGTGDCLLTGAMGSLKCQSETAKVGNPRGLILREIIDTT